MTASPLLQRAIDGQRERKQRDGERIEGSRSTGAESSGQGN